FLEQDAAKRGQLWPCRSRPDDAESSLLQNRDPDCPSALRLSMHTETKPYPRNAAVPRGFERDSRVSLKRPDWLAEGLTFACQAVSARSVTWGRSVFVVDAKLMALSRCARRSGICTISYCIPGYRLVAHSTPECLCHTRRVPTFSALMHRGSALV